MGGGSARGERSAPLAQTRSTTGGHSTGRGAGQTRARAARTGNPRSGMAQSKAVADKNAAFGRYRSPPKGGQWRGRYRSARRSPKRATARSAEQPTQPQDGDESNKGHGRACSSARTYEKHGQAQSGCHAVRRRPCRGGGGARRTATALASPRPLLSGVQAGYAP